MPPLRSNDTLKTILREYFQSFFADPAPKVAWCSSVGPSEILTAFGYKVFFPENHGALLGVSRQANKFMPVAHARGYSPDICSYLTSDIGAFLAGETPLTRAYGIPSIPPPDLIVYNTNQCHEVQDWFSFYARHFDVPCLGISSPSAVGPMGEPHVGAVAAQLETLIGDIEAVNHTRLDRDRLREVVGLSARCSELWGRFLRSAQAKPSPITFFDGCIQMAPAVMLRGEAVAVEYYELLNAEIDERVAAGVGAVEGESLRFYWDGMPVWGRLRFFSELFATHGVNVVASTYCNSWIFDLSAEAPIESMARAYTSLFINRSEAIKEDVLRKLVRDFSVDAVMYHDAKTCPHNSNCRFGMPQRMLAEHGIPFHVVHGDLNDLRCFSDEQTRTSVEAFVEQVEDNRH